MPLMGFLWHLSPLLRRSVRQICENAIDRALQSLQNHSMDNEIRIFHYKYKQYNGIYWAILAGGKLHFVEKWTAHVPIQSQEHVHLKHPHHENGEGNLPNFHLLCFGKVELLPNPELGRVQSAQIVPITP